MVLEVFGMGFTSKYGVDEIDNKSVSLIDFETGLPLIVNISEKINLKEGDIIRATISPTLCSDGLPNCFAFTAIEKI